MDYKPGQHSLSNDEYNEAEGLRRTVLTTFAKNPALVNNGGKEETPALRFGIEFHNQVFTPEEFNKKDLLKKVDITKIKAMAEALSESKTWQGLIKGAETEQSIFWIDRKYGIKMKAKLDVITHIHKIIAEAKTSIPSDFDNWPNTMAKYLYHWQQSMYSQGWEAVKGERYNWIFVVVEKTDQAPRVKFAYDERGEWRFLGDLELEVIIDRYLECKRKNLWPASPDKIEDIGPVPRWYYNKSIIA
jgi:hypothetical protein